MLKKEVSIAAFVLLLITSIAWVWLSPSGLSQVPDVTLKIIDGRQIELKQLQGQPVLVTFWATTCIGCAKEIPHLKALYEELSPKGLEIIGIAMAYDPPNQVLEMTTRKQIPYPIALDVDGNAASAFGNVMLTPTSFLIAPNGTIVKHKIGEMDMEKIRNTIITMLSSKQLSVPSHSS